MPVEAREKLHQRAARTTRSGALLTEVDAGTLPTLRHGDPNAIDVHEGSIAQCDAWISNGMPTITSGPDCLSEHLAVLIIGGEGSGSGHVRRRVLMPPTSPHYSLLEPAQDVAGEPGLDAVGFANSLPSAFGF